jgi:hypothetical protein
MYVNSVELIAAPVPVVGVTLNVANPVTPAGTTAVICVELSRTMFVAVVPLTSTVGVPVSPNPVPIIVTLLPPVTTPELGVIDVMAGRSYVYADARVIAGADAGVTTTVFAPAELAGVVAVIVESLIRTMLVAEIPPNVTVGVPEFPNPTPVIVTLVLPVIPPRAGTIVEIAGAAV